MTKYLTHTPIESRNITPAALKKFTKLRKDGSSTTVEELVQQYLVFLKYDGICALLFYYGPNDFKIISRTDEEINNFDHIGHAMDSVPWMEMCAALQPNEDRPTQYKSGVYFGELWSPDLSAAEIGGLNNLVSAKKIEAASYDIRKVRFVVWDFVTHEEWANGHSPLSFTDRIARLEWMNFIGLPGQPGAPANASYPPLFFAPCEGTVAENAATSVNELAKEAKTQGRYDGIICVHPDGTWTKGARDPDKIKFKPTVTVDLKVVGYEMGKGKYSNVIGKVICEYGDTEVKVSGMTDGQRGVGHENYIDAFFKNDWKGQIIEVEAMEVSAHGKLREPRFKRFRSGIDASAAE